MKNETGFSLVELSISLAIIAFIMGVTLASNNLYNQSKLRAVIKEFQMLNNAINTFKDRYSYLPGDLPNPPSSWNATSGDAGGGLNTVSEYSNAWHHLYMAGLINQPFLRFTGASYNQYKSIYKPAFYVLRDTTIFQSGASEMFLPLEYGALNTSYSAVASYSILNPKEAYYIDSKIDDGIANYGILMGVDGDDALPGNCSAQYGDSRSSKIDYNLSKKINSCRLYYFGIPNFSN